jgi:hypothetical protein
VFETHQTLTQAGCVALLSWLQEMLEKAPQLPSDIRWHFIGHLQSNKVKAIIGERLAGAGVSLSLYYSLHAAGHQFWPHLSQGRTEQCNITHALHMHTSTCHYALLYHNTILVMPGVAALHHYHDAVLEPTQTFGHVPCQQMMETSSNRAPQNSVQHCAV